MAEIGFDHGRVARALRAACPRRCTLPSASTMTREHSDITNSILCSITTKVARCSRLIACKPLLQIGEHGQVDAAGGLVEQHQPRPAHERHRGVEQLLLAVAQAAGRLRSARWTSLKKPIIRSAASVKPGIGRAEQPRQHAALMLLAGEDQIVAHRQFRKHLQQLKGAADAQAVEIAGAQAGDDACRRPAPRRRSASAGRGCS